MWSEQKTQLSQQWVRHSLSPRTNTSSPNYPVSTHWPRRLSPRWQTRPPVAHTWAASTTSRIRPLASQTVSLGSRSDHIRLRGWTMATCPRSKKSAMFRKDRPCPTTLQTRLSIIWSRWLAVLRCEVLIKFHQYSTCISSIIGKCMKVNHLSSSRQQRVTHMAIYSP